MSETPSARPSIEDNHHDPLLAMAHDFLNQSEITDSSDIAQLHSVNKANIQKDSQCTVKAHNCYIYAQANEEPTQLIDRCTNGCLTRSDMHILQETTHKINIVGINDHELTDLQIVTAAVVLPTKVLLLASFMNMHALERRVPFMPLVNSSHSILRLMSIPRLLVANNTL